MPYNSWQVQKNLPGRPEGADIRDNQHLTNLVSLAELGGYEQ